MMWPSVVLLGLASTLIPACGADAAGPALASSATDGGSDVSLNDGQVDPPDSSPYPTQDGSADSSHSDSAVDDGGTPAKAPTLKVPVEEAVLFYMGNRIPATSDAALWRPYLSYVDASNHAISSYLYDSFVLLDIARITEKKPTKTTWTHFLDQVFSAHAPAAPAARALVDRNGSVGAVLTAATAPVYQTNQAISGGTHTFEVWTKTDKPANGREALIAFTFRDSQGNKVKTGVTGLVWSDYIGGKFYKYLPSGTSWMRHRGTFQLPSQVTEMDVEVRLFTCPGGTVSVDRAIVTTGATYMNYDAWAAAGFNSLVMDGDFRGSGAWGGFKAGPGLEHAVNIGTSETTVTQPAVAVKGGGTYTLSTKLRASTNSSGHQGIVGVRIMDAAGKEITTGLTGMSYSKATTPHMFYQYADASTTWADRSVTMTLPASAAKLQVYLVNWAKTSPVSFDEVQFVEGTKAWSDAALAKFGYKTLIADGNVEREDSSPWVTYSKPVLPSGSGVVPSLDSAALASGDARRRNVIIGIPIGVGFPSQTDFGEVNGKHLNLTKQADQLAAISWYVNEALARWKATSPKALDLAGFYWMHEGRSSDAPLAGQVHDMLHAKGMWLTGSPYRGFLGKTECYGSSFNATMASKFDRIWQQPNVWPGHHWNMTQQLWDNIHDCLCHPGGVALTYDQWMKDGYPACELGRVDQFIDTFQHDCKELSAGCNVHVNVEWVPGLEDAKGYGRVLDYINLDHHLSHDYGRFPDRMWYEAAGFGWKCALSGDSKFREQYEKVHAFIEANRKRHGFPQGDP